MKLKTVILMLICSGGLTAFPAGAGSRRHPMESCTETDGETAESDNRFGWLDRPHDIVSLSVLTVSDRIDSFFDTTGEEEVGDTRVRITTGVELREGRNIRFTSSAGIRLDLPHLERRWNLFLENIDVSEERATDEEPADDLSAGLRLLLQQTQRTWMHADSGLRFSPGPIVFGRLRFRGQHVQEPDLFRFTQFITWYSDDGFGEATRLEHERTLGANHLFATRFEVATGEAVDGIAWSFRTTLADLFNDERGWAVFGDVRGSTAAPNRIDRYRTGVQYRRRLYRDWLFLDIEPLLEFSDDNDFNPAPVLNIRLETIFGRI